MTTATRPGAERGRDDHAWVVERLQSWGAWARSGGSTNGYGESCLTLEEIRALPVRAYVPVCAEDCERVHEALRKLPAQLYKLAIGLYIDEAPMRMAAKSLRVSEQHGWRLRLTLLKGLAFLLKNPSLKAPPMRILLNS